MARAKGKRAKAAWLARTAGKHVRRARKVHKRATRPVKPFRFHV